MRVPDLTPALARALERAPAWAARFGAAETEPLHLLLALLEDDEGRAATLLTRAGADLERLRRALHGGGLPPADPDSHPQHPRARSRGLESLLQTAARFAAGRSAERTVSSDELLSAVIDAAPDLRRAFELAGADLTRLEPDLGPDQLPPVPLDEPLVSVDTTSRVDALRVIDASANRAREALRVVEDYCRFVLDDAFLTEELKTLRHDLAEALSDVPGAHLLEARETLRDVGTAITTAREQHRPSLTEVVTANLKRLQEALRSLEEFGKFLSPEIGRRTESARYRSYTLERAVLFGGASRHRLAGARLYLLVTGSQCLSSIEWTIAEAAAGGVGVVQLREKTLSDRDLLGRARSVARWCRAAGAIFIMNDRPDVARLAEADGVHLGQDDMAVKDARRVLGPDALIGVSTHDLGQVRQAILDGANYLGVGPAFPSGTKSFEAFPGLGLIGEVARLTTLPAFLIGGVGPTTIGAAVRAGARRVAVSQAICRAEEPRSAAAGLRAVLDGPGSG